jgi:Reverse transcriptase (RNA-dependent DNA polymerase)
MELCVCGCGCGTRVATPPACRSAAPPCRAPGSKPLLSAFLRVLPRARRIIAVHVDDCILTGSSSDLIAQYKAKLNTCHALTDLGPVHWLLGIKITRDQNMCTISLFQVSYIDAILSRFALTNAKSSPTPMVHGIFFSKNDSPSVPTKSRAWAKRLITRRLAA